MKHHKKSYRPGFMPSWQRIFSWISIPICSLSGISFLLGSQFQLSRSTLSNHSVLTIHGISAMAVLIILGSILPAHLKVGLYSKKNMVSGLSQLALLLLLTVSSAFLYYGSEDLREAIVLTHWVVGLAFFCFFLFHGFKRLLNPINK